MRKIFCFSDGVRVRVFFEGFANLHPADTDCEFPSVENTSGVKFYYNASQVVEFEMIG